MTPQELQDQLCKVCTTIASTATIARMLHRQGFTLKKVSTTTVALCIGHLKVSGFQVTCPAVKHDEADQANYKMLVGEHFRPGHFIFTDESHFNHLSLQQQYAWAPHGNCVWCKDFFIWDQKWVVKYLGYDFQSLLMHCRYSILPALSLDGILHLEVLDHSFTGDEFCDFVEGVLDQMQPLPLPNSVLVLDNASIHKISGLQEMVEAWCVLVISLQFITVLIIYFTW